MSSLYVYYICAVHLDTIRVYYSPTNAVYSRTVRQTHINKDTTNICSHITTDLIIH